MLCASFETIQTRVIVQKHSIRVKIGEFFCHVWTWNLTDDLERHQDTFSMPPNVWGIISKPSVNSNWIYSPGTLNLGPKWKFMSHVFLKVDGWPRKTIGHLFYATSSNIRKHSIGVTIGDILPSVTLKFDLFSFNETRLMYTSYLHLYIWKYCPEKWERFPLSWTPFISLCCVLFAWAIQSINVLVRHLSRAW